MNAPTETPQIDRFDDGPAPTLSEAEQIIEALNEATELDAPPRDKARRLLERFQALVGHDADVELVLQTDITREPAPTIVDRVFVGPTFDRIEPRPDSAVQALLDESAPAIREIVPDVLERLRQPHAYLVSRDVGDGKWFGKIRDKFLRPHGWEDLIVSDWATGERQMVGLAVLRRGDMPPLGEDEVRLTSLMLRAMAPLMIREMFDGVAQATDGSGDHSSALVAGKNLSPRQTGVLHLLLRGMSEKEVARELGVSTHTVHTHVKRLYTIFDVTSRGELLALFVDERVLKATA